MESYTNFVILTTIATTLVFAGAALALTVQPVKAIVGPQTPANSFAPGQEAKIVGPQTPANIFAPGQEAKIVGPQTPANSFAPGEVKKQPPTCNPLTSVCT